MVFLSVDGLKILLIKFKGCSSVRKRMETTWAVSIDYYKQATGIFFSPLNVFHNFFFSVVCKYFFSVSLCTIFLL